MWAADFCGRFLRYACARNAHLRRANSAFSRFASLASAARYALAVLGSNVDSPKAYMAYKAYRAYGRNVRTERYGINPQPSPSHKLGEGASRAGEVCPSCHDCRRQGGWHLPILFFLFFLSFLFFAGVTGITGVTGVTGATGETGEFERRFFRWCGMLRRSRNEESTISQTCLKEIGGLLISDLP